MQNLSKNSHTAIIAIGSNLNNPIKQVSNCISYFKNKNIANLKLLDYSSLYWSDPAEDINQPKFINAIIKLQVNLRPLELLNILQNLEKKFGRVKDKARRYGPRVLDLDILLYGNLIYNSDRLIIPHLKIFARDFWLEPLKELGIYIINVGDPSYASKLQSNLSMAKTKEFIEFP